MPCYDPREGDSREHDRQARDLLCKICKHLAHSGVPIDQWAEGLYEWFERHDARDASPELVRRNAIYPSLEINSDPGARKGRLTPNVRR